MEISGDSHDGFSAADLPHTHQTLHISPNAACASILQTQTPRDAMSQAINLLRTGYDPHVVIIIINQVYCPYRALKL